MRVLMMTSVKPTPEKQCLHTSYSMDPAVPRTVRLVLNGRTFEVTEEMCEAIPLVKKTLWRRKQRVMKTEHGEYHGKPEQTLNGEAMPVRRNSLVQCRSVLDSPNRADDDVISENMHLDHASCQSVNRSWNEKPHKEDTLPNDCKRIIPPDTHLNSEIEDINNPSTVLYFQRNASIFETILDFVQNGELHVPGHVCPKLFARDLTFWGFSVNDLDPCCYAKVISFVEEQKTVMQFYKTYVAGQEDDEPCDAASGVALSKWYCIRHSLWKMMTDPWSSLFAKLYYIAVCLVILTSFFVIAASTTDMFTRTLTRSEWQTYLGDYFDDYEHHISDFYDDDDLDDVTSSDVTHPPPSRSYSPRALVQWLQYVGYTVTAFLVLDYLLRLIVCPSFRRFFTDVINISDAIALCATFAKYIIDTKVPEEKYEVSNTDIIHVLQLFRILRFLRPMSKVKGFRVIYFTLKNSVRELLLLFALLGFLVMIFSALLYYLGDRQSMPSIPTAMWYALVTMTTVGYGDVVPLYFRTKLIGCVCAILGVLFLAMTLPIVVNNFLSLYTSCSIVPPGMKKKRKNAIRVKEAEKHDDGSDEKFQKVEVMSKF